jgi:hypothetical protein
MRENAADEDVRRLNGIPEGEEWAISGSFSDPARSRVVEQGPLATPKVFLIPDTALGYRLKPNLRDVTVRSRLGGKTEFEAKVSTGRFGWRMTPQVRDASDDVLFLGDVFGETVNDSETLPSRFSAAFGGKALAHNFGVPGWSAADVLNFLEQGGEKAQLEQKHVTKVIYFLGAGRTSVPANKSSSFCSFSSLCSWLLTRNFQIDDEEVFRRRGSDYLNFEVFIKMRELIKKRYGVGLTLVDWNRRVSPASVAGLDVVELAQAIPGLAGNPRAYVVDVNKYADYASEPNARALSELGTYLAQRLGR